MQTVQLSSEQINSIIDTIDSFIEVDFIYLHYSQERLLIAYYCSENTMNYLNRIILRLKKLDLPMFWIGDIADFNSSDRFDIINFGTIISCFNYNHAMEISETLMEEYKQEIYNKSLSLSKLDKGISLYIQ